MMTDKNLRVSSAQSVTATAVSTDAIDLRQARELGKGESLEFVFTSATGVSGGTTIEFQIIGATAANLTTGQVVLQSSGAIAVANLAAVANAGMTPIVLRLDPKLVGTGLQFLGAKFVVVGSPTGTWTVDVVPENSATSASYYPTGFSFP